MSAPAAAPTILDRVYLEIRAKLLEVAASLDRIERADDAEELLADHRMRQIHASLDILQTGRLDRAERIQLVHSDQYDPSWPRPRPRTTP
jgi:hypothetical protein